ncbi:DUF1707 SHOCT-like domain-containing protein [Nocardia veterana]|uniref:DUF1707 domain-containing protein n=1 Tax=Nocardia veterana TaxID=132249 RepID=A0A7X6LXG0_9NOCA|nr:DUF1707 domain-containing protein [Nocardia veterana]NKY85720.1 DUF1707 domain-containing protein [Nocardia veterana]
MGGETVSTPGAGSAPAAGGAVGDRDLRVSDAEREHVGTLLQRAVGLGMLSLGEFSERMDTALAAKTRGELNAVLVDLPGIRLAGQPNPVTAAPPGGAGARLSGQWGAPGGNRGVAETEIRPRLSGVTRKGPWQVPPSLFVNSIFSGVTLDFTQAVMATQVVEIRVDDFCSSLTMILPGEATVDLNGVELIGSSTNNKVRTGPPMGPLHVVVHGRIRFSSITAKHPFGVQWKKLMSGF